MLHGFVMLSCVFLKICSSKQNSHLITGRNMFCIFFHAFYLAMQHWHWEVAPDLLFMSRRGGMGPSRIVSCTGFTFQIQGKGDFPTLCGHKRRFLAFCFGVVR